MTFELHRHDARHVSELLEPESVDLIITSPPYFALRSYRDGGEHYDGQLGSEATPTEFVDALIECTRDWLKVLKPTGSLFVNLGDKYAGSRMDGSRDQSGPIRHARKDLILREQERRETAECGGIPAKSKMGLPWRYANRAVDELGLILRADIIWNKPNGLPESVQDRVRGSHEYLFHFTRQGRYFAAIDEIREAHIHAANGAIFGGTKAVGSTSLIGASARTQGHNTYDEINPLGKVPSSVWTIASEPLQVPDHLGVDHFAAFPSELPRRCILGWTPSGWCTACGEARRPVVDKTLEVDDRGAVGSVGSRFIGTHDAHQHNRMGQDREYGSTVATITGYACACPTVDAPTTPSVIVDPFCGTGTTPAVAHLLGRHGIGVDLSRDYLRLAEWRCTKDTRLKDKVLDRTGIPNPNPPAIDGQLDLFGEQA